MGWVDDRPSGQRDPVAAHLGPADWTLHPLGAVDQMGQVDDDDQLVAVDADPAFARFEAAVAAQA